MWIMSPFGVLMPCRIPPKYQNPKDNRTMQVRARRAKDLDILRALYMQNRLGKTLHSPDKDYEYRAYCTPEDLKIAMCDLIDDCMNYDKFKPETLRFEDWDLYRTYNKIWNVVMDELSTDEHRHEYFHKFAASSRSDAATGTGYPAAGVEAVATGKAPAGAAGAPVGDAERLDAWYAAHTEPGDHPDPGEHGHSATVYELPPAPDVDDNFGNVVPGVSVRSEQIEEIYARRLGYNDHAGCDHLPSDSADEKCRRAYIRADDELIEQLRREIEGCYDKFIDDIMSTVHSDK